MIGAQNDSVVAYLDCDWLDAAVPVGTLRWEILNFPRKLHSTLKITSREMS